MNTLDPDLDLCRRFLQKQPPPGRLLLCSVTGSHLYGFPSPDSDVDIKGVYLQPTVDLLGLGRPAETHDVTETLEGVECDLTTNEAKQALLLLLAGNGNMLERILSPFQIVQTPELSELHDLAVGSLSKVSYHHYAGYFRGMQEEHKRTKPTRAKSMLYTFRVALTGIHLLNTGEVQPNLSVLADIYHKTVVKDLIQQKQLSQEHAELSKSDDEMYRKHWPGLEEMLSQSLAKSNLPAETPNKDQCNNWLVALRSKQLLNCYPPSE